MSFEFVWVELVLLLLPILLVFLQERPAIREKKEPELTKIPPFLYQSPYGFLIEYSASKGWSKFPTEEEIKSVQSSINIVYRILFAVFILTFMAASVIIFYWLSIDVFLWFQRAAFLTPSTIFFKLDAIAFFIFITANLFSGILWILCASGLVFDKILPLVSKRASHLLFVLGGGSVILPRKFWAVLAAILLFLSLGSGGFLFDKFIRVDESGITVPIKGWAEATFESKHGTKSYSFNELQVEVYLKIIHEDGKPDVDPHFDFVFSDGNRVNIWGVPIGPSDVTKEEFASLISFLKEKNVQIKVAPISEEQRAGLQRKSQKVREEIEFVFDTARSR